MGRLWYVRQHRERTEQISRSSGDRLNPASCPVVSHWSRGIPGQSDPPRNGRSVRFALDVGRLWYVRQHRERTEQISRSSGDRFDPEFHVTNDKAARLGLNQGRLSFKLLHVMSGQGVRRMSQAVKTVVRQTTSRANRTDLPFLGGSL
jgi:hypothetical protein